MSYRAGTAFVEIKPDFRGFHLAIDAEFSKEGDKAGKRFAGMFHDRAKAEFARPLEAKVRAHADVRRANFELDHAARDRTARIRVSTEGTGKLGRLFSQGANKIPVSGMLGGPALLAIVPAAEAAMVEVTGLAAGFAAAGAGAAGFAALALPAFKSVAGAYSQIGKDQKAYRDALTKTAKSDALKKLKADWAGLDPAQRGAVRGLQKLSGAYHKLSHAFEPRAFKVFNDALKVAGKLLPDIVPFANTFADTLDKMLGKVGKFAGSKGFKDWLKQFHGLEGPALNAIGNGFGKIAVDVGKLFTIMSKKDVVHSINIAFGAVDLTLKAVSYMTRRLMDNWDGMSHAFRRTRHWIATAGHDIASGFLGFAGIGIKATHMLTDVFLSSAGRILHGAADLVGWVPGIGGKLKAASAAFDRWKGSVDATFSGAQAQVASWKRTLDSTPKIARLKGDIRDLTAKLNTAKHELADPHLTSIKRTIVKADITSLQHELAAARKELNAINGKTVTTFVKTVAYQTTAQGTGGAPGIVKGTGHHAAGTPWAPPGWAWVGERGPELMRFRGGEQVLSHAASLRALSALRVPPVTLPARLPSAGGPLRLTVSYTGSGNEIADAVVSGLRFHIQASTGGDVQAALGQGAVR